MTTAAKMLVLGFSTSWIFVIGGILAVLTPVYSRDPITSTSCFGEIHTISCTDSRVISFRRVKFAVNNYTRCPDNTEKYTGDYGCCKSDVYKKCFMNPNDQEVFSILTYCSSRAYCSFVTGRQPTTPECAHFQKYSNSITTNVSCIRDLDIMTFDYNQRTAQAVFLKHYRYRNDGEARDYSCKIKNNDNKGITILAVDVRLRNVKRTCSETDPSFLEFTDSSQSCHRVKISCEWQEDLFYGYERIYHTDTSNMDLHLHTVGESDSQSVWLQVLGSERSEVTVNCEEGVPDVKNCVSGGISTTPSVDTITIDPETAKVIGVATVSAFSLVAIVLVAGAIYLRRKRSEEERNRERPYEGLRMYTNNAAHTESHYSVLRRKAQTDAQKTSYVEPVSRKANSYVDMQASGEHVYSEPK